MAVEYNAEREYKILKKQKYETQLSEVEKKVSKSTTKLFIAIGTVIATIIGEIFAAPAAEINKSAEIATYIYGVFSVVAAKYGVDNIKELLLAISEKTVLEGQIETIINDLQLPETEEKGMTL